MQLTNSSSASASASAFASSLFVQTASKTVNNSSAETTLTNTGIGSLTVAANTFTAGTNLYITIMGLYGTDTALPGTLNIKVKIGATTICTIGATALPDSITNGYMEIRVNITCRTIGSSGTFIGHGVFVYSDAGGDTHTLSMLNTSTATINTTTSQAVNVTAQFDTADADNTITAQILTVTTFEVP